MNLIILLHNQKNKNKNQCEFQLNAIWVINEGNVLTHFKKHLKEKLWHFPMKFIAYADETHTKTPHSDGDGKKETVSYETVEFLHCTWNGIILY